MKMGKVVHVKLGGVYLGGLCRGNCNWFDIAIAWRSKWKMSRDEIRKVDGDNIGEILFIGPHTWWFPATGSVYAWTIM